jgi:tape measure domain-containing protein
MVKEVIDIEVKTKGTKKAAKEIKDIGKASQAASVGLSALKSALLVAFSVSTIKGIVDITVKFESMNLALKAVFRSSAQAAKEMSFIRREADRLGLDIVALTRSYTELSAAATGTINEGQDTRDIFTAVAEASTVLGLTAEDTEGALRAIAQIMSKGKVQAEELRGQLGERLPGAYQIAARAIGKTTGELSKMLELGQLISTDFLPKFAAEIKKTFSQGVPDAAKAARAEFKRLGNAIIELKVAIGNSGLISFLKEASILLTDMINLTQNVDSTFNEALQIGDLDEQLRIVDNSLEGINEQILAAQDKKGFFEELFFIDPSQVEGIRDLQLSLQEFRAEILAQIEAREALAKGQVELIPPQVGELVGVSRKDFNANLRKARASGNAGDLPEGSVDDFFAGERLTVQLENVIKLEEERVRLKEVAFDKIIEEADVLRDEQKTIAETIKLLKEQSKVAKGEGGSDLERRIFGSLPKSATKEQVEEIGGLVQEIDSLETATKRLADAESIRDGLQDRMIPKIVKMKDELSELRVLSEQFPNIITEEHISAFEEYIQLQEEADDLNKRAANGARDFGVAIGTAFEEAILQATSLQDVMKGLLQDILKVTLRLAVTAPLEGAIGTFLKPVLGAAFGGGTGGGGLNLEPQFSAATGLEADVNGGPGGDSQVFAARVSPNEHISIQTPGQQSKSGGDISLTFNIDGNGSSSQTQSTGQNNNQTGREIAALVIDLLQREKRPGGVLNPV